jgi:hypothetical protein
MKREDSIVTLNDKGTLLVSPDTHHKYLKNSFIFLSFLFFISIFTFFSKNEDWLRSYYYAFDIDKAYEVTWGKRGNYTAEDIERLKVEFPVDVQFRRQVFFIENSPFIFLLSLCFYSVFILKTKPKIFIDREHGIAYSYLFNHLYVSRFEYILAKKNLYESSWPPFHLNARHTTDHPRGPLFLCLQRYNSKRTGTFWLGDHTATSTYMNTELKEAIIGFMTDYESKTEEEWRKAFDLKHTTWLGKVRSKMGEFSLFPDHSATLPKKVQKQLEEYLLSK